MSEKIKMNGNTEREVRRVTPTSSWKIDWCQVRSVVFTITAIAVLLVIGCWVGTKFMGSGGVNIFIDSGEKELLDGDSAQGVMEKKWTQVRIEKTSGRHVTKPPDGSEESSVLEFNATNAPAIFSGDAHAISFLFVSKKGLSGGEFDKLLREYQTAAKEFKGEKVTFAYVDIDREDAARVADFFAVKGEQLPAIRMHSIEDGKMLKYKPESANAEGKLRSSHMVDFIRSHLSGALKPYYRSEPTPSDWDRKAVKVLTGDNFDQVVRGGGKHVFVEFYASWCGHCKTLAPIWEQLADKYKDHSNIVIAQMDAIANEVPGLEVHAFPTIKLFPAAGVDGENRQGVDYNGPRTVEGFSKFIDSFVNVPSATGDDMI